MKTDYSDEIVWEIAPKGVVPECKCRMFGCEDCFKQEGWDVIFGGGEVFPPEPRRGMPPPC